MALVGSASDSFGFPPEFIEKDYFVTEILRSLTEPFQDAALMFKGGTSLSKAFGLIDRMSEDVDLTLIVPDGCSIKHRESILIGLTDRVSAHPLLRPEGVSSTRGTRRYTTFYYTPLNAMDVLVPGVLLELGIRGGLQPRTSMSLQSYIAREAVRQGANEADFDEFRPVTIDVLAPERTLVEKLAAVHHWASRLPDAKAAENLDRGARHYYDIARLLEDDRILEALPGLGDFGEFVNSVNEDSRKARFDFTDRPPGGFADSPAFSDQGIIRDIVEPGYARAMNLVPKGFERPSLDYCLEVVRRNRAII